MANIQHSVVYCICVSARGLEQFILNAKSLATLLGDGACLVSLRRLQQDTQMAVKELESNKHVLTSQLGETIKRIATQQTELDRLKAAAIADMMREDRKYQLFAGMNLETAMTSSESTAQASTVTENNAGSGREDMDNADVNDDPSSSKAPTLK